MNEKDDAPGGLPSQPVSEVDLDRPNPDSTGNTDTRSFAQREATQEALQANDAEKMTPDEANELSTDDDK